jgi:hypothetical protein
MRVRTGGSHSHAKFQFFQSKKPTSVVESYKATYGHPQRTWNPVKSIGPLASLSNKQRDGLSVAEVLKRDVQ